MMDLPRFSTTFILLVLSVLAFECFSLERRMVHNGQIGRYGGPLPYNRRIDRQGQHHGNHATSIHGHSDHNTKDMDTSLDDLLVVLGPHLFLIPFVLKAVPFALPALPLSYILSRAAPPTIQELMNQLMEHISQLMGMTVGGNGTMEGGGGGNHEG